VVLADVAVVDAALDAACDALLAAWLLLVDDVQPAIDNEVTITSTTTAIRFGIIRFALTTSSQLLHRLKGRHMSA
jgi:hypothetical protein